MQEKVAILRAQWDEYAEMSLPEHIPVLDVGAKELDTVVDVLFQRKGNATVLGFYDIERENLVNAAPCPALIPDLQKFLTELSQNPPPIEQASFRLRVNPHDQRGLWINTSNLEIRSLLNQKRWLRSWMEDAHIEMGQQLNHVQDERSELRLNKPLLRPWFSTHLSCANKDIPLWTVVGGYTHSSIIASRQLVHHVLQLAEKSGARRWLEFGSGCGTFTLPFAEKFDHITATEISSFSREGLNKAAQQQKLQRKIVVSSINLQRNSSNAQALFEQAEGLLVNPPRSGLHDSLKTLKEAQKKPHSIIYVSCYPSSLAKDSILLQEMGYKLKHIEGIDQFPNTSRCEWIVLFQYTKK